jgi:nucleoside-diphosphate-sugar epimerase
MKTLVTGGSGKLGRAVVDLLHDQGHHVINLDRAPPRERKGVYTQCDLTDYGQVLDAVMGIDAGHGGLDAIVHLAAIPGPSHAANAHIFHTNTKISYNVFQAARLAGIKNIVFASSETLLGVPFDNPPLYVPVDEEYSPLPEWHYSLSKLVDEVLAREFCRWDPELKMLGLRFSYVMEPADYVSYPELDKDPMARKWNLWSYVDSRDCADAVCKALASSIKGFDTFIIAAADTVMSRANDELLAEVYPGVTIKDAVGVNTSLLSSAKASRILGYVPRFSWRQERERLLNP